MTDCSIRAENLSKQYRIGRGGPAYRTLRDSITSGITQPLRRTRDALRRFRGQASHDDTVWAVKDLSFEVKQGEVVGIVGCNGAGKSTLLKILSRITEPTAGYADVRGRVGSLLEVGAGFHQELTGRENVYLNGAILGMSRAEISRKFDAIVDFAEVQKFIDTPVKHYSSGMYLRLAFSVAAHLEPEILLVDEVLAVGDVAFQKKCLGRMEDVAHEGRTVLFVSHNMGAIRNLCNRGIFLKNGGIELDGDISKCIHRYYDSIGALKQAEDASGTESRNTCGFENISVKGETGTTVDQSRQFEISTALHIRQEVSGFSIYSILEDMHGRRVFHLREESTALGLHNVSAGRYPIKVKFPPLWLNPGLYAFYFKVQLWGEAISARHLSDKYPLDVQGISSMTEAVLHPEVEWAIQDPVHRQRPVCHLSHASLSKD